MKEMYFSFYSCILEGRQLWVEEPFLLVAPEAVRAVCKAGFQTSGDYMYEQAQPPNNGMFLFKVTRITDGFSILVFFDTRTKPNFIWVDNVFNNELDITIIGKENIARVKISRLIKANFVEKIGEFPENGSSKAVYQKTGLIMR